MSEYLPFAGKNSIAEMSIGIQFLLPFDLTLDERLVAIRKELETDLPKYEPLQSFTFSFSPAQQSMPGANVGSNLGGFSLTRSKADMTAARILRVVANSVSVHFMEYSSWDEVKPRAIDYIKKCLTRLDQMERNPAVSVLVRYLDRFTFDGIPEKATANLLFQPDTKFVAPRILDSGHQWHSNAGWFEPLFGETLVLNNLNVSSAVTQSASGITVDHSCLYTFPVQCKSLSELLQGTAERPKLDLILDKQHRVNADVLKNLLNRRMLNTIGLT